MNIYYATSEEESFRDTLATQKGSVICNPDYGTNLFKLKHRSFDSEWVIDFRRCLKDACRYDPRLKFRGADIDSSQVGEGTISYKVYIENKIIEGVINV
jgi:phage baseplate assembly protein W